MSSLKTRITILLQAIENWLKPDNLYLKNAIDKSVSEGYFSFPDIKHAILALKDSLNEQALIRWVEQSGLMDSGEDASGKNVLCLHAGNLPLVGFQDALAVLLSGARYTGKISRKDPYLLPTFLNEVKKTSGWSSIDVQWAHRLDDLEGMQNDMILFAGSEESVPGVREAIKTFNLAKPATRYLIRTAHFSIAYLNNRDKRSMEDLTEAIFRYGGKGCRSVAIVVAPWPLDSVKCEFTDYIEAFWLENPQHQKPPPRLRYRFAYNKAIERPQAWLDHFLLQEGGLEMDQDFICYWVQGDEQKVAELAAQSGDQLQSVYITHPDITIPGFEGRTEFLSDAQRPPIFWKPDGVNILKWLARGRD